MNLKKLTVAAFSFVSAFSFAQTSGMDAVKSVASKMVSVEGGTFKMGNFDNEKNESPVHEVTLSSFYMCSTEITQAEYEAVTGENYSNFKGKNLPVEEVSWYDAVVFCNKLSLAAGVTPVYSLNGSVNPDEWGDIPRIDADDESKAVWNAVAVNVKADGYRLPTEAEWEYVAKGGNSPSDDLYCGSSKITECAWNKDNSEEKTYEPGAKKANALGLYDMSGNVWEWCYDWYGNYRYANNLDPLGESDATVTGKKIRRGGSILSEAVFCRNNNRASSVPELRGIDLGFRVVRSAAVSAAAVEEPEASFDENEDTSEDSIIDEVIVDDSGFDK